MIAAGTTLANPFKTSSLDNPAPTHDQAWAANFQQALAWSTQHQDRLVAPLVPGAALQGWHHDAITASDHGHAWATHRLAQATRSELDHALDQLLTPYGAHELPTRANDVPDAFVAPLATLLDAQHITTQRTAELPDPDLQPWTYVRQLGTNGAWLLGVLDAVLPALHDAAVTAPDAPLFVDPLGLVILGGNGDDTYDPPTLPVRWMRPTLVVEPAGNDVYNRAIATSGQIAADLPVLGTRDQAIPTTALAIDLDGHDTYNQHVARGVANTAILLDQNGNDHYATTSTQFTTAFAWNGLAILSDSNGDDHYHAKSEGIAYANTGIALLADHQGNDRYQSATNNANGFTHAAAENIGSLAILRDYQGDDTYRGHTKAFASAEDDSIATLIDDIGTDTYHASLLGQTSWGRRYASEQGLEGPLNRGLAYFVDGRGVDAYSYDEPGNGANPNRIGNEVQHLTAAPDLNWGVFLDCQPPAPSTVPCEDEHGDMLLAILTS